MLGLNYKLAQLEENGKHIMTSIVGAGQMGRGMVGQIMSMKGMRPAVVVDINIENAINAYQHAGLKEGDYMIANTISEANELLAKGKFIVTDNPEIATKTDLIDCAVDATGVPEVGAKVAIDSINAGKHIVMLNVEADVCIGPMLYKMAQSAGVVYTGSAGDEPGSVLELYDFADALGFDVRVIGKGKNNKVDKTSNPDSVLEEATLKGVSPKMLTSFKDGTKTMVEMTAMSNATGYLPDIMGGHGAKGIVSELPDLFRLKSEGGILNNYGIVDYIDGVAPGVFIIVSTEQPDIIHELNYLSMGKGPNYVLYRPYHLCSLETPLSVAKAVIDGVPTIAPRKGLVSETITVAKRDLVAGEYLDGIGGFSIYGSFEKASVANEKGALPMGIVNKKTKMINAVKKGEIVTYADVALDNDSLMVQLRKIQDTLYL
ncbi:MULTISPECIES: NAD(P)H-dependent oxidoreductase [unclassified Acetobacterium]|jgi:predicted homoserine dehydrogenase-like protein|uniref:NAD(P)H-dependent oxidoreductase n=1 Tax=unclassified Acetobacterium TaxID=2638182 RepID=UPI000DBEB8F3|nr:MULTISPECIES: NAD(P)-dependent oxidoreductase [unclassified Acetobacterium]AWW26771.1 NAD(P)-dependent oxidoreductase [Acetobacterium sp. KB-1]MDZ5725214.1 NAD(P)-dependent oxidoreductase [Acetobacterium sp. K1/6]